MKKTLRLLALSLVLVAMVACLASCGGPAKDPDDSIAALKEADYLAAKIPNALGVDGVDCVVSGTKLTEGEHVTIVYFDDKDAANDAWDKLKEHAEKEKDDESDWTVKKSGAMIYWGTSDAIKAAK